MDIRQLPVERLVYDFVLYGCLPLWVVMGFVDWICHRRSQIERNTGIRESLLHATMGVQVGVPIFLGLFFDINVLLLLLMIVVLIFHEWVADQDVRMARAERDISMLEMHVHSFLEVIPFVIVSLVACMNWPAFVDLMTLHWAGHLGLAPKPEPLGRMYVAGYVALMLALGIAPYVEEMWRCWRFQHQEASHRG